MTTTTFPPATALLYSLTGSFTSAMLGYGLGRLFGRNLVRRLGGRRINRISDKLARRGTAAVVALRVLPVEHPGHAWRAHVSFSLRAGRAVVIARGERRCATARRAERSAPTRRRRGGPWS